MPKPFHFWENILCLRFVYWWIWKNIVGAMLNSRFLCNNGGFLKSHNKTKTTQGFSFRPFEKAITFSLLSRKEETFELFNVKLDKCICTRSLLSQLFVLPSWNFATSFPPRTSFIARIFVLMKEHLFYVILIIILNVNIFFFALNKYVFSNLVGCVISPRLVF